MFNANNNAINTKSIKLNKCGVLIRYIYHKIMEDEEIKRLVFYHTINPLDEKGLDYDGKLIDQPNVNQGQVKDYIFDLPFNPAIKIEKENSLYINLVRGAFYNNTNKITVDINIVCSAEFLRLNAGYRHMEISQKIADLFDGMRVDKGEDGSFFDVLYNSKFDLTNFETIRLSNTSDYIWSRLTFEVTTSYGSRG